MRPFITMLYSMCLTQKNRLRIAMTAQVTLITDEAQNTLLIPIQAVHRNEGKKQQVPGAGSRW